MQLVPEEFVGMVVLRMVESVIFGTFGSLLLLLFLPQAGSWVILSPVVGGVREVGVMALLTEGLSLEMGVIGSGMSNRSSSVVRIIETKQLCD